MSIKAEEIKIFEEGTKTIYRKDIRSSYQLVVIPHSVSEIEKDAFSGNSSYVVYVGTVADFDNINLNGEISTPCIYCTDGLKILAL